VLHDRTPVEDPHLAAERVGALEGDEELEDDVADEDDVEHAVDDVPRVDPRIWTLDRVDERHLERHHRRRGSRYVVSGLTKKNRRSQRVFPVRHMRRSGGDIEKKFDFIIYDCLTWPRKQRTHTSKSSIANGGGTREVQYVPTLTLDTLLDAFSSPDFTKIDI
jgi:hypothetical protein